MTATLRRRPAGAAGARLRPEDLLGWFLIAALALLVGLPLVFVLLQAVAPGIGLSRQWSFDPGLLAEIADRPLWQTSLVNSLTLAGGTMIFGTGLGCLLALARHTVRFPGTRLLDLLAWILLVCPSFILAQGWVLFASPQGPLRAAVGVDISPLIFSPGGLIAVMSLTQFPLAYLATTAALHWNVDSYRHAAALAGASPLTVLRTVRLPLLTPAVLSGAILVFVDTLGDFGLPAALSAAYNFPTLPSSIYASVRQSPVSFELGGVLSCYLVVIIMAAIVLYMRILRRSRFDFLTGAAVRTEPPKARRPWLWSVAVGVVIMLSLGLPLGTSLQVSLTRSMHGGLHPENLTLEHYGAIFTSGSRMLEGLTNSVGIAVAAAALTTVLGFLIGVVLTFTRFPGRRLIDLAGTITLAVPGIVLAVGFIFVWNQPVLARLGLDLYGSPLLLVFAGVATALPIAVRLQLGALSQIPETLLHAAGLSGAGLTARLRTVVMPLVLPAIISAFAAVLASGVFDLAGTTMLAPPNFITLPVEILGEYDRGLYGYASAGALISAALVVGLAALSSAVGERLLGGDQQKRKDTTWS